MLISTIHTILQRDLKKLKEEIHLYQNPADLWKVLPGTTNSAGNLVLHLVGNLRHFIGGMLGSSGYIREREAEFGDKDLPLEALDLLIDKCVQEVEQSLNNLKSEQLEIEFPQLVSGKKHSTGYLLIHLASHFGYHLGQINYHRRYYSAN